MKAYADMTEEERQADLRQGFLNRKKMWLQDVAKTAKVCGGISTEQMFEVLKNIGQVRELFDWSEFDKFLYGGGE